jgi:hypothetical protein
LPPKVTVPPKFSAPPPQGIDKFPPGTPRPLPPANMEKMPVFNMKKGGKVKDGSSNSGGNVSKSSSASKRGDGIAQRGKTKGRML